MRGSLRAAHRLGLKVDLDILLLRQTGKGIDIGAAQPLFADLNEG